MTPSSVGPGSLVGERLGKYHLLALVASGDTAELYLARIAGEAGFEKYVVVKCLLDHLTGDSEFVRMFLDEARLCAQLDHSNIVQTLELGQHEGRYYIVMEHLAGLSLAQLASKTRERSPEGVIPARIVLGLAAQACSGLHYAHQRTGADGRPLDIVHGNVSPQNLAVTFGGILKIVGFGIAEAERRQTHRQRGTVEGKFAYMSPEQCRAEPLDRRTDVFALGTVVHELLTARRLAKGVETFETHQAILEGNAPPPSRFDPELDEELDQVVLRALAYQREDRFDTAESFGEAILSWLHGRGLSVSATDVSRYVETVCDVEIQEHAANMRQLISGHRAGGSERARRDPMGKVSDSEVGDSEISRSESASLEASPVTGQNRLELVDEATDDEDDSSRDLARIFNRPPQRQRDDGDFAADTQIEFHPAAHPVDLEPAGSPREADRAAAAGSFDAAPFRVPLPGDAGEHPVPVAAAPGTGAPALDSPAGTADREGGREGGRDAGIGGGLASGDLLDGGVAALGYDGAAAGGLDPDADTEHGGPFSLPGFGAPASESSMPASGEAGHGSPGTVRPGPVAAWGADPAQAWRHRHPAHSGPAPYHPAAPDFARAPLPHVRPASLRAAPRRGVMPVQARGPVSGPDVGRLPLWLLAAVFLLAAGLGLGVTVLLGALLA